MAVDFYFYPPSFSIPRLYVLHNTKWARIPNEKIRDKIAQEDQYLAFHRFILKSTRSTKVGHFANPPYRYRLDLSVRAGAVKALLLLCASIAEATLRAHAEARGYQLAKDPYKRTFGNVLGAWKTNRGPRPDVAAIADDLDHLRDVRNNIHLFKAANDPCADFDEVLKKEYGLVSRAEAVVEHLSKMASPVELCLRIRISEGKSIG